MATNFASAAYVTALQTLLDRHAVPVKVRGFRPGRDYEKFADDDGSPIDAIAELVIDGFASSSPGVFRSLDGTLSAGLLVLRKLNDDEAEEVALELAFDVATALVDEIGFDSEGEPDGEPVMAAGPILVTGVEPEQPDGAMRNRVCGWLVSFQQAWRITRTNQPSEPAPLTTLYLGREPNVGEDHVDDYRQVVPEPEL